MSSDVLPRECGPYTLVERIGAGGMAVVYKAVHTKLGHEVALKMIRREVQHEPAVLELMTSEVRALAQIRHPHVVEVQDVFDSESGEKCLVMELVRAPTLRQLMQQGVPLIFPDVMHIGMQMASAIGAAHLAGVVHRDLKPDNIAIEERAGSDERRWHVKILDFGVAKLTRGVEDKPEHIVGTLAYLGPEVLTGAGADGRSDIYGFGIILYEMLVGTPPLDPTSPAELLKKRRGFGEALQEARPDLPHRFVELVDACTAYDPQERPPSMQHVIAALQQVFARSAAVVHSAWTSESVRPMRTLLFYALVGAAFFLAFLYWYVRPAPQPGEPVIAPLSPLGVPEAARPPKRAAKKHKTRTHRSPHAPAAEPQNLDEPEDLTDPNDPRAEDVEELPGRAPR